MAQYKTPLNTLPTVMRWKRPGDGLKVSLGSSNTIIQIPEYELTKQKVTLRTFVIPVQIINSLRFNPKESRSVASRRDAAIAGSVQPPTAKF